MKRDLIIGVAIGVVISQVMQSGFTAEQVLQALKEEQNASTNKGKQKNKGQARQHKKNSKTKNL